MDSSFIEFGNVYYQDKGNSNIDLVTSRDLRVNWDQIWSKAARPLSESVIFYMHGICSLQCTHKFQKFMKKKNVFYVTSHN